MKIQFQNLVYSPHLSQETPSFRASLVVNGKPRGIVRNDGRGGANLYTDHTVEREIDAYAATLPPADFDGMKVSETAETLIFGIVYDAMDDSTDPIGEAFRKEARP